MLRGTCSPLRAGIFPARVRSSLSYCTEETALFTPFKLPLPPFQLPFSHFNYLYPTATTGCREDPAHVQHSAAEALGTATKLLLQHPEQPTSNHSIPLPHKDDLLFCLPQRFSSKSRLQQTQPSPRAPLQSPLL